MTRNYPNEDEPPKEMENKAVYRYLAGIVSVIAVYVGTFHLCYKDPVTDTNGYSTTQPTSQPSTQPTSRPIIGDNKNLEKKVIDTDD